ncbi:MAG TPA: PepSY-like domain-containing protein [Bacteroidales bacterium]|nr:PepSY-like domain-containing protein [Bacteroidales bacterium]
MKTKILILVSSLLISISAWGQNGKDVPANVKSSFSQKFSRASGVKWSKENDKEWEAEFKMDGKEYSANFDNAGTWLETEYEVAVKEIPSAVKATLDKESMGFKIEESALSETKNGKAFEFVISKGETEFELSIDTNGKLLSKEQLKEEDEDDEK